MTAPAEEYVEPGGSWTPFWTVAGALALFLLVDVALPGPDVPPLLWLVAVVSVLGVVGASTLSARRLWTLRVQGIGDDGALVVGRERVPLADIDADHLRSVDSGADAGAPVLGGGWSLPRGRTGLPLKLADGRTVLVPTRDPAALRAALLDPQGTLEP
ncbi:hypothetical protein [Blastococcus saxobsidens]|uniref:DUF3093 domain-containing protein n=1 Tax=Blastococcus saxobsidens TaxID=138336 RepID=A0A4Q7Y938_9ACTN|nr:hypothetical protein [Blastococcus saxobsidens]RZU33288.1 hypothetical protein BKA19_3009 [Blastococcus saxobsidens]